MWAPTSTANTTATPGLCVLLCLAALLSACAAPQPPRADPFAQAVPATRPYNPVPMLLRQTQAAGEATTRPATPTLGEIQPPYIAPDTEPPNNPTKSPTLAPTGQAPTRWQPAPVPAQAPAPAALPWGADLLPPNDITSPLLGQGLASWYGKPFHGRRTASGERYDMHAFTAAHKTLPLGSRVRVRRVNTGQEVVVRINDRGPFVFPRIIDLSYAAAKAIGMDDIGLTEVLVLQD